MVASTMRRRWRFESTWNGSTWVTNTTVRYIYDGNLVIQERDANNLPLVSYTRGCDLSGSLEGAGGIGGLLARTDHALLTVNSPLSTSLYHCDGNGNATLVIYTNQSIAARYVYDPYGNIVSEAGSLAEANLYRSSSKEFHGKSGLNYYLFRFYDPKLQRWLNRDPVAELGDMNLFCYCFNRPADRVDPNGDCPSGWTPVGKAITITKSLGTPTGPVYSSQTYSVITSVCPCTMEIWSVIWKCDQKYAVTQPVTYEVCAPPSGGSPVRFATPGPVTQTPIGTPFNCKSPNYKMIYSGPCDAGVA